MIFEEVNLYNTYGKMRGGDLYEATAQTLERQIKGMGSRPVMGDYGDSENDIRQMELVFSTPEEAKRIASEFNSKVKGAGASIKNAKYSKFKNQVIAIGHNGKLSDKVVNAMSKKDMQLNKIALEIAKNTTDQYAYAMGVETDFDEEVAMDTERFAYGSGAQKTLAKAMEQEKANVSVPKGAPKRKAPPKAGKDVKLTDKEKKKFDDIYKLGLKDPTASARAIKNLTPDEFKKFASR